MRLIDADKLKEKFENMIETPTDRLICLIAKQVIDSQPTAYDVDKVVERLEERKITAFEISNYAYEMAIDDAIDIVKRGGIDEVQH